MRDQRARPGRNQQQAQEDTIADRAKQQEKTDRAARTGTDEQILHAAAGVFTRLGYTRTTIADIATEAGSTRPTVYSYFSSKEDVFRRLAERVRDQFTAAQRVPEDLPADQIIRLADIGYLRSYSENAGLLTILQHQALADPSMSDLWQEMHTRINRSHIRFMERLVEEGEAVPAASLDSIANAVNGLVMRFSQLVADDPSRFDKLADDLVRIHLAMLGLTPDARARIPGAAQTPR
ncbi:TetR/AcrR family transcriptional regulator [Nocardioides campestrisoli]|uniref:TetR/AcrR family transcriptional regulator n=1 Tax=Nocardioides campestrisoli TaxID=2736757 RepID=UPI00163DAEB3|nr:TetR/AcrR family transcriptional regulator [Nocardioides campestrisoli]